MTATNAFALSGTVKDDKGVAIAGASVSLVSNPAKKSTSSANGEFSIDLSASLRKRGDFHGPAGTGLRMVLDDGRLQILANSPTPSFPGSVGLHSLDGQRATLRDAVGKAPSARQSAAAIDTLLTTKAGFASVKTAISAYDQTGIAIVMKPATDTGSPLPAISDYTLNGPYNTVVEANVGPGGKYTVIRPEPMGANGFLHAPIVYGPGISTPVSSSTNFLKIIASHGFVIVGCNMLTGGPNDAGNNTTMRNGIKWIVEQNTTAGSKYFGKIATTKGVSMGYSVGGTAAVDIGDEPSLATVVSIHGHISKTKLHGPLLQTSGTKDNVGLPMQQQTFTNSTVQTFLGTVTGADHGYIMQNNGGAERPAIVAWLRYWIYNDQGGKKYFYGTDCVMCKSPWENPQRKNWQ